MLRSRWRIHWSSGWNAVRWLCWKYLIQPRKLRLISLMMSSTEPERVRWVLARSASFNLFRLFLRGHR